MCIVFDSYCDMHWVASTCSTSLVPMPKASVPNAPCVEVWLSPQTIVCPGCVKPSSGPMTCTMPWLWLNMSNSVMPGFAATALQGLKLPGRGRVQNRKDAVLGRDRVIHNREGQVRPAHLASGRFQSRKCLRGSDFVDQVAVNVDQRRLARRLANNVRFPNFAVHRARIHICAS